MNRLSFFVLLALVACNQAPAGPRRANLIGTHDLVLVGDPSPEGFLANKTLVNDVFVATGVPSRFLFVTSADTNELRVLDNYPQATAPLSAGRNFIGAPNPLETLSIPVLDRPTILATDEGRDHNGSRVTGSYVYAARPGGAEVSVVSLKELRQLSGKPFTAPAPVTAIDAFMEIDQAAPILETPLPTTTRLWVATWDGASAAIYAARLFTDSRPIDKLTFERQVLIGGTPISAMIVVPPVSNRTLDGAAYCATKPCLAVSTRGESGMSGSAFMVEPESGRIVQLPYLGPVRDLVNSANSSRIYGVLDEQACGGPACGGVVAVDVVTATTAAMPPYLASFTVSLDATGAPLRPMRADGLITGLTVGTFHLNNEGLQNAGSILQQAETPSVDGGVVGTVTTANSYVQDYTELGAYSSSSGVITFFSGLAGSVIDYDPRRSTVVAASVRVPGMLDDGGLAFVNDDGGVLGTDLPAVLTPESNFDDTFRVVDVTTPDTAVWTVDISDGYIQSQSIFVVQKGQIPGLVSLPTTAAAGVRLTTGGLEGRALVGDVVQFETGTDLLGFAECGRSTIATIGAGFIEVTDVPATCADRVRFSVRAQGSKSLVVVADIEGYLGRWAPGETLTYNRPYVLLPAGVVASRTSLTISIPSTVPAEESAFVTFQVLGFMAPYQVTLDTLSVVNSSGTAGGCFTGLSGQVVMGNMLMDRLPTFVQGLATIDFRWSVVAVVPSGNSLLEFPLNLAHLGALDSSNDLAICRR